MHVIVVFLVIQRILHILCVTVVEVYLAAGIPRFHFSMGISWEWGGHGVVWEQECYSEMEGNVNYKPTTPLPRADIVHRAVL